MGAGRVVLRLVPVIIVRWEVRGSYLMLELGGLERRPGLSSLCLWLMGAKLGAVDGTRDNMQMGEKHQSRPSKINRRISSGPGDCFKVTIP